jgi:glutaredoxin 3
MSDNNIIIYSKKECPYCIKAKDLLKTLNLEYNEIILDPSNENYKETVDELKQKYNHYTFPFIIVNDIFLGGFKELDNANNTLYLQTILNINIDDVDF